MYRSAGTRDYQWPTLCSWQKIARFGDKSRRRNAAAERFASWWWWWWWCTHVFTVSNSYDCATVAQSAVKWRASIAARQCFTKLKSINIALLATSAYNSDVCCIQSLLVHKVHHPSFVWNIFSNAYATGLCARLRYRSFSAAITAGIRDDPNSLCGNRAT